MKPEKKSRAEYYRDYRAQTKSVAERDAYKQGFKAGVDACIKFLREFGGDRAFTGYRYALWIQQKVSGEELFVMRERRKLVESLGGGSAAE